MAGLIDMSHRRAVLERRLELHMDGEVRAVVVSVDEPELDPLPGGDWRCRFSIDGIPGADTYTGLAHGIDTVQAMLMALQHLRLELLLLQADGSDLTWLGSPDLGFPSLVGNEPTVDEWRRRRPGNR